MTNSIPRAVDTAASSREILIGRAGRSREDQHADSRGCAYRQAADTMALFAVMVLVAAIATLCDLVAVIRIVGY